MKIELKSIPISDLITGYSNDSDNGVRAYGGKLDVRPPYQREFRYDDKQKRSVIETIMKGFPLNIMYWSEEEDAPCWRGATGYRSVSKRLWTGTSPM